MMRGKIIRAVRVAQSTTFFVDMIRDLMAEGYEVGINKSNN